MVAELPDSFTIPGSVPFKWEIQPGVPKAAAEAAEPPLPLQLRPPPAGIRYSPPKFPPLFGRATPPYRTEYQRSRTENLRYSKALAISTSEKWPAARSFVRRMPSPSPPRFTTFSSQSPSSSSSSSSSTRDGSSPRSMSKRSPGCFPLPSLLKRTGDKSTAKETMKTRDASDIGTPARLSESIRSFASFREETPLHQSPISFSSFRKSPLEGEDMEWAIYGMF